MHTEAVWNKKTCMGLPGGPVVKVLQWKLQVCEFDLWLGNSDPSCSWGAIKKKKTQLTLKWFRKIYISTEELNKWSNFLSISESG